MAGAGPARRRGGRWAQKWIGGQEVYPRPGGQTVMPAGDNRSTQRAACRRQGRLETAVLASRRCPGVKSGRGQQIDQRAWRPEVQGGREEQVYLLSPRQAAEPGRGGTVKPAANGRDETGQDGTPRTPLLAPQAPSRTRADAVQAARHASVPPIPARPCPARREPGLAVRPQTAADRQPPAAPLRGRESGRRCLQSQAPAPVFPQVPPGRARPVRAVTARCRRAGATSLAAAGGRCGPRSQVDQACRSRPAPR